MLNLFQEAALPKLSETSLYMKYNETSGISQSIKEEILGSATTKVKPEDLKEIIAMIRLNGDAIAKAACDSFMAGEIVLIYNKETSKIPPALPYIVMNFKGKLTAFVFADKVVNKLGSTSDYTNLMATLEAAYLALKLQQEPTKFTMNAQLMLTLCKIYTLMVIAPLEQKVYMKGDNLNKAMMYVIVYFYNMVRGGNAMTFESIPFKSLMRDKIDAAVANQIIDDVVGNEDKTFIGLIKLIQKINPLRYKNLDAMYMSYFTSVCGITLIFALENIGYLFMLIASALYKTPLTAYGINKALGIDCKRASAQLTTILAR